MLRAVENVACSAAVEFARLSGWSLVGTGISYSSLAPRHALESGAHLLRQWMRLESVMVKYFIEYQHLPKGSPRPHDDGEIVGIEVSDKGGFAALPNVGDYIHIDNSMDGGERAAFSGKVRSRYFRYIRISNDDITCLINIVVEETSDDLGKLVKE